MTIPLLQATGHQETGLFGERGTILKYCKYCNANIEGLINHCDCCGAPISANTELFVPHTFTTVGCGAIPIYIKEIFEQLNRLGELYAVNDILTFSFYIFCFPTSYYHTNKKTSARFYSEKSKMEINVVIDYDEYISVPVQMRAVLVRKELLQGFLIAKERCRQKKIDIQALAVAVERVLFCQ